jgi:hypothetical protein
MNFFVVLSMCCGRVFPGAISLELTAIGTRVYTHYKHWSEGGFFWRLLYHLQSLKKLCMVVVFVDGSLVPFHRHGSVAKKNKDSQFCEQRPKGLGTSMHMAISEGGRRQLQTLSSSKTRL